jgi:hypothetical protein
VLGLLVTQSNLQSTTRSTIALFAVLLFAIIRVRHCIAMSDLQKEQQEIDARIVYELIEVIPETWNTAVMEVDYLEDGENQRYSHSIKNPEGLKGIAFPSDAIFVATRELFLVFKKHGFSCKKVVYTISLEPEGDWSYQAKFEY